jgi:predicted RNase H-like nuclease (RuvC/YqgF family)
MPETVLAQQNALRQQLGDEAQRQSSRWFTEEEEKLERYGDDLEKSLDAEIDVIEDQMQELKRTMRQPNLDLAEKVNIKRQISGLDARRDELIAERYARKKRIRDDINKILDEIADSLKLAPEETPLFSVRWEVSA